MNKNKKKEQNALSNVSDENGFIKNYCIVVKNNKLDFFIWVVVSFFVALIGIWLPCIIHALLKLSENYQFKELKLYSHLLESSPYILYSITFLGETVLSTISLKKVAKLDTEKRDEKILLGVLVAIYILIMAGILVVTNIIQVEVVPFIQHILLIIAIILGLRLYPLKENLYEPTVNTVQNENDNNVEDIINTNTTREELLNA